MWGIVLKLKYVINKKVNNRNDKRQIKQTYKQTKMNTTEKELHNYIAGTERMSGFDSYDSAEGDMSNFDDYDSADGDYSEAAGSAQAEAVSAPYIIQYANTTAGDLTGIFMGFNDYSGAANYGNPTGIVLSNLQGGTYGRLINQSNNKNFVVGKWRFTASGTNITSQLNQTLSLNHVDANGITTTVPINMSVLKDLFQFSTTAIDVTRRCTFDGNTFLTFPVLANTTLVLAAYPTIVLSGKAVLNGGANVNKAIAPRLSGKNIAPVIIQTTQDVRGLQRG